MDKPTLEWYSPTPTISWLRKISIYQTKNEYIMIGSNNRQTRFRILKVDRKVQTELKITDDKKEYGINEISEILNRISNNNSKIKKISAFGIVGFIRFLEGYYMILISRRRKVAKIGAHMIYKIMETTMFYLPNMNKNNQDEIRYLKMFQNVDLSSNFYFSYSYDITHTLQYNLTPCNHYDANLLDKNVLEKFNLNTKFSCVCEKNSSKIGEERFLDSTEEDVNSKDEEGKKNEFCFKCNINKEYAIRTKPNSKFVWNEYLLELANIHPDWLIYIIHGYVGQTVIKEFGKELYLTLIARRSKKFAGTRFLKRGTNQDGDVANEVESEQIISEIENINFNTGKFSSFVHMRGSIPCHWSQDISKMVPKPQILIDIVDPFSVAAGKHFNQLLSRYGSPIIVLNLVKMKEKRPHEGLLTQEITRTINYLNQFIPPAFHLQYVGMDMARINKSKDKNVLQNLSLYAYGFLKKVGIFQSFRTELYSNFNLTKCDHLGGIKRDDGRTLQTGIIRINCVDSLDRTNTAAYMVGKTALAFQLFGMGLISDPLNAESNLIFEKKVCKKLEQLYEEHGDVLALQYGGSQLVHRIKTYRKKSHLSSQSRDFMQTISRYCSNTFSDFDKQMAINLFLGAFRAYNTLNYNQYCLLNNSTMNTTSNNANSNGSILQYSHLWEMSTDFYLHNLNTLKRHVFNSSRLYTKWYDEKTFFCLPRACNEVFKGVSGNLLNLIRKPSLNKQQHNQDPNSQMSNISNAAVVSANDLISNSANLNQANKLISNERKKSIRKNSFIKYHNAKSNDDESTDEYNEHYYCYEYTSFDSMHYFELSRLQKTNEKTPHSSTGDSFNPLSFLFGNMKSSFLGEPKMITDKNENKGANQSVSSESSEDESSSEDLEKVQTLNNDSSDFLFSFNLDLERTKFNNLQEHKNPIGAQTTAKKFQNQFPQLTNSTSENTNLKSLSNRKISSHTQSYSNSQINRRFSFNGQEESSKRGTRVCKSIYGPIYTYPNKVDQKMYSDYVIFGSLSGEFSNNNNNSKQESVEQYFKMIDEKENNRTNDRFTKKNRKSTKNFTSENDLSISNYQVNFKRMNTTTANASNQLTNLLNYNSLEFRYNQEINDQLEQINSTESNKEDKKLLVNYLNDSSKIKVSSRCKEDYKQYLRLVA